MDNQEDILDALRDFEKKPPLEIPPLLEHYLGRVASTGETIFPWPCMKPLFVKKLDEVMQQFETETHMDDLPLSPNVENVKFDAIRRRILQAIDRFHGAPFTIQRLCELITDPKKHYRRADKFLRGIEKNILVVSTVDPFGRKIVSESKTLVNGLDSNGHMQTEKSIEEDRIPPCAKSAIPSGPETNWLSSEVPATLATVLPLKGFRPLKEDTECELAAGEGAVIDKNIEQSAEKEQDQNRVVDDSRDQSEPAESSEMSSPPDQCQTNVTEDVQNWPVADSTQSCVKDSGDAVVLPDSQETQSAALVGQSHSEETIADSGPNVHSDTTTSHPFPEVLDSAATSDQSFPSALSPNSHQTCETSDSHTMVSSSEEDSNSVQKEDVQKEDEPSSSKEGEQDQAISYRDTELPGTTTSAGNVQMPVDAPEEGISSSGSNETASGSGENFQQPKDPNSSSVHQELPDSPALSSESEVEDITQTGSESVPIDKTCTQLAEDESASGSCETADSASSSSDSTGIAMETEDSNVVTPSSNVQDHSNPTTTSTSLENPSPTDEPMDQV